MKKTGTLTFALMAFVSCKPKNRVDDLAFKFCDKVSVSKTEYLKCFTDIVECHSKSSDKFDNDLKFIECARLFQVNEPTAQPFKYLPTINENDLDEEVWREIENLDRADDKKKKTQAKVEYRTLDEPKPKPAPKPTPKPKPSPEIARELPKEVKWKVDALKKEKEEADKAKAEKKTDDGFPEGDIQTTPVPEMKPEIKPGDEFDF